MKKKLVLLLGFLVWFLTPSLSFYAEEINNFSVIPLDIETGKPMGGYYDLILSPNTSKTIKVKVLNRTNEEKVVRYVPTNGSTNDNGITSYEGTVPRDSSLTTGFTDLVNYDQNDLILPPNSSQEVTFDITMPEESFDGVILGGLYFKDITPNANESAAVTTTVGYAIGVLLRNDENQIKPEIKMNEIKANQDNSKNFIGINLQNIAPTIIKKLTVDAKIYEKKSNKLAYTSTNNQMRMAPNSNFTYKVDLQKNALIPGDYRVEVKVDAGGELFEFEDAFTISRTEAKKLNNSSVYIEQKQVPIEIYVVIGLVLVGILVTLSIKNIKRKQMKYETK